MAAFLPEILYEPFHVRDSRISQAYLDIKLPMVLSAIACQIIGMSILRTLATCGFTACLLRACALLVTTKNPEGLFLSPYLKNTRILMLLAIALLLEPPLYYFGLYGGPLIYLLPRILLVATLFKLPKDCIPLPGSRGPSPVAFRGISPPPPYIEAIGTAPQS